MPTHWRVPALALDLQKRCFMGTAPGWGPDPQARSPAELPAPYLTQARFSLPMAEGHQPPPAAGLCRHTEMPTGTFLFVGDQIFMAETRDTAKGTYRARVKGPEPCRCEERPSRLAHLPGGTWHSTVPDTAAPRPVRAMCRRLGSQLAQETKQWGAAGTPAARMGGACVAEPGSHPMAAAVGGSRAPLLQALGLLSCQRDLRSCPLGILVQTGHSGSWTQTPAAGTLWQRRARVLRFPEERLRSLLQPQTSPESSWEWVLLVPAPVVQIPAGSWHGATSPTRGSRQSPWGGRSLRLPGATAWTPRPIPSMAIPSPEPEPEPAKPLGKGGRAPSAAPAPSRLPPANSRSLSIGSCFRRADD